MVAKEGKCDACGERKPLKGNRGKQICSTCAALYAAAANRPELVLQVLRELRPELLSECLPVQDNTDELERQLHEAQERADLAETMVEQLGNEYRGLQEELSTTKRLLHEHQDTRVNSASTESVLLDLALDVLKGEITGLKPERIEALRGGR